MNSTSNAAGVLIQHKEKFLLCKRGYFNGVLDGYWAIPGGTIDEGETAIMAAIRELYEEAGILLKNHELKFLAQYPTASGGGTFYIYHYITPVLRHISLNFEHDGYAYFAVPELPRKLCNNLKSQMLSLTKGYKI